MASSYSCMIRKNSSVVSYDRSDAQGEWFCTDSAFLLSRVNESGIVNFHSGDSGISLLIDNMSPRDVYDAHETRKRLYYPTYNLCIV